MERLNDIYLNRSYDDNTVLMRIINTILEQSNNDSKSIYIMIVHFAELLNELHNNSSYSRPEVKYVIDEIQMSERNNNFDTFSHLLSNLIKLSPDEFKLSKNIFIMCYCRSKWETFYEPYIGYTKPSYATKEALGEEPWSVFLEAFQSNDYMFIKK